MNSVNIMFNRLVSLEDLAGSVPDNLTVWTLESIDIGDRTGGSIPLAISDR